HADKSVGFTRRSFNADQPRPPRSPYPPLFIKSCRVARRQPGLLQESHPTQLWIASVRGLTIVKEGLFGQTTRLAYRGAGKEDFRAIRRLHLLIQGAKLDETGWLQALPFIDRHRATHILRSIRERSACFLHFGGR